MALPTSTSLIIVLLILLLVSCACVGALWLMRRRRRAQEAVLPQYNEKHDSLTVGKPHHRRVSAAIVSPSTKAGLFAESEQKEFYATAPAPAITVLPQIQLTLPEEVDTDGKHQSGRVVVLHMDEKGGLGLEPVHGEDQLPAYSADGRFESLDLERIGGLKEKELSKAEARP